jgi:hypothetical protein
VQYADFRTKSKDLIVTSAKVDSRERKKDL